MNRTQILRMLSPTFTARRPVAPQRLNDFAYGDVFLPDHLLRDIGLMAELTRRHSR